MTQNSLVKSNLPQFDIPESLIKKVKYKDWNFIITYNTEVNAKYLSIYARVFDRDTDWQQHGDGVYTVAPIEISFRKYVPLYTSPGQFYDFVKRCITEVELHEIDEFLLINNQRIYDPHK